MSHSIAILKSSSSYSGKFSKILRKISQGSNKRRVSSIVLISYYLKQFLKISTSPKWDPSIKTFKFVFRLVLNPTLPFIVKYTKAG